VRIAVLIFFCFSCTDKPSDSSQTIDTRTDSAINQPELTPKWDTLPFANGVELETGAFLIKNIPNKRPIKRINSYQELLDSTAIPKWWQLDTIHKWFDLNGNLIKKQRVSIMSGDSWVSAYDSRKRLIAEFNFDKRSPKTEYSTFYVYTDTITEILHDWGEGKGKEPWGRIHHNRSGNDIYTEFFQSGSWDIESKKEYNQADMVKSYEVILSSEQFYKEEYKYNAMGLLKETHISFELGTDPEWIYILYASAVTGLPMFNVDSLNGLPVIKNTYDYDFEDLSKTITYINENGNWKKHKIRYTQFGDITERLEQSENGIWTTTQLMDYTYNDEGRIVENIGQEYNNSTPKKTTYQYEYYD
jgi:hypothetical protein